MDTQQANLCESSFNTEKKRVDDKESPSFNSCFNQKEEVHQRILASQQNAPTSASPTLKYAKSAQKAQVESQPEELSPSFGVFYKALMTTSALMSTGGVFFFLWSGSEPTPIEQLGFVATGWTLWQFVSAYQGFTKKELKEIENAWFMMKVTFFFIGLFFGIKQYHQVMNENYDEESIPNYRLIAFGVLVMGLHLFLHFLPTRKVLNFLKLALKEEEEKRKMETQDPGSLKQLDSPLFLIYKYGLLIFVCLGVHDFGSIVLEDISGRSKFWKKMTPESNFFLPLMERYVVYSLCTLFCLLAFEGIRKRDLKKLSISAMLMKIFFVAYLLLQFLNGFGRDDEGHLTWKHEKNFGEFLQGKINFTISFFGMVYMGVFKAQEILKAREKSPRYSL